MILSGVDRIGVMHTCNDTIRIGRLQAEVRRHRSVAMDEHNCSFQEKDTVEKVCGGMGS